jgi:filamentous hemagglutinin family protein
MVHNQWFQMWRLGLASSLTLVSAFALSGNCAFAQITPDETLGNEQSVVVPNRNIQGQLVDAIEGGARRGTNLFHSFRAFNIGEGQRVYFTNPNGVENILSRVTGSGISDILGTLGVDGRANLFLLNPNGIIFGPNAQLDVGGSFLASTSTCSSIDCNCPHRLTVWEDARKYHQPVGKTCFGEHS